MLTRSELLKQVFQKDCPKGSQEYGTLANLITKSKIPFTIVNGNKLFDESKFNEIKKILKSKLDEIKNPNYVSSLEFSKQMGVAKTTMQLWLDQGLISGFVKEKGIDINKLTEAKQDVEKLKLEKSNILNKSNNIAHEYHCKVCGTNFKVKPSHYLSNNQITCSEECKMKYIKEQKTFYGSPSNEKIEISDELREIIEGELLGDGCLNLPGRSINACFQYSTASEEYALFLKKELEILISSDVKQYNVGSGFNKDKTNISFKFHTKTNISLTEIYNEWYIEKFKRIPKDLVLTSKVCLHWMIGDGYLSTNKDTKQQRIELCTNGFLEEDVDLLISKLKELNFDCHKYQVGVSKKENKKFIIIISSRSMTKFLKYIGTCPVKCYEYKWNVLDPTYEKYETYIYSTTEVGEKLGGISKAAVRYYAGTKWFTDAKIDCTKMWSRLRFSEKGLQQLKEVIENNQSISSTTEQAKRL